MVKLDYKLMAEEHGPTALVRNTVDAEQARFAFAAISDHSFRGSTNKGMRRSRGRCLAPPPMPRGKSS